MQPFNLDIENLSTGGFCKAYWKSDYITFGNKNNAQGMRNMDLRNPHRLTQGPSLQRLTNGDESGVIGTLVLKIMPRAFASNETFGVAGKNIIKITPTTVTVDHAIDQTEMGAGVQAKDVTEYGDLIYYVFDRITANKATIGQRDAALAYDDNFMERSAGSTVGTFSLTFGVPHKLLVGGDDILYCTNGNEVSSYDRTSNVGVKTAIDLPYDAVVTDIEWNNKKLIITVDWPNLTGSNRTLQRIFVWNTVDSSWDDDVPQVRRSGALYTKEGITFVFYEDITSDGGGRLGYFDGAVIKELFQFKGTLPKFYQVDEKDGFITWVSTVGSEDLVFCWGSGEPTLNARGFQLMKGKFNNAGAIGLPFGSVIIATENGLAGGDNIRCDLSKESGYTHDAYLYGMTFPTSLEGKSSIIKKVMAEFDQLQLGAGTILKLRNSAGTLLKTFEISYSALGRKTKNIFYTTIRTEDIRPEIDPSSFVSTTTIVLLRRLKINGFSINV